MGCAGGRGAAGVRGGAGGELQGSVLRRPPLGPAACVPADERDSVLAQPARVWYARAFVMAPLLAALALLALLPGECKRGATGVRLAPRLFTPIDPPW